MPPEGNNSGADGTAKSPDEVDSADNYTISEDASASQRYQTAIFKQGPSIYSLDASADRDPSYNDGYTENVSLGDFFSRPVRIYEGTWTTNFTSSTFNKRIDPWVLWQSDARVKDKLSNFAYASFDLKIRIVLNGTPFQYGRMMVTYVPYGNCPEPADFPANTRNQIFTRAMQWYEVSGASGRVEQTFQHLSTYPTVYLDPSTNQVKDMTLPFLWHDNYISLCGDYGGDKVGLGQLQMLDINPLRIANTNAPVAVNFTIYAWAENVKLTVPTEFVPTSTYSSLPGKKSKDEYDTRPSTIASSVASAAGQLTRVPIIGPFARATQIGAGATASIARLFGFSTPTTIDPPKTVTLKQHGRLANYVGEDSAATLSLDPKQEITVDPRTAGVRPEDEMTIKSIVTREQFLARCEWKSNQGQFGNKLIFASLVNPNQIHRSGTGTVGFNDPQQAVMDHPAGWIANMFQYWKGSVTYRVEVVCTSMHSGRLKLQFDPFMNSAVKTAADFLTEDVNARYTMILDLKEAQETEFTINWNNRRAWLRTQDSDALSTFQPYRNDLGTFDLETAYNSEVHMGIFTVSIVNELVAPISTSGTASATQAPVQVNIYFKGGEDLTFAQPSETSSTWSTAKFDPNSTFVPLSTFMSTDGGSSEMSQITDHSIMENMIDPNNTSVFFGENIISLRSLIKRYTAVSISKNSNTASTNTQLCERRIPWISAHPIKGKTARRHSFLSYLAPAFIVVRGSTRCKVLQTPSNSEARSDAAAGMRCMWVEREGYRTATQTVGIAAINLGTATTEATSNAMLHGYNGMAFTASSYSPCLEFNIPFYSNTRFALGVAYRNVIDDANETAQMNPAMTQILLCRLQWTGTSAQSDTISQYAAAGDDFSMSFFTGVPFFFFTQA
jgi:hypothetical protein